MSAFTRIDEQSSRLIQAANQESIRIQSQHLSSGHLLLALLDAKSDNAAELLRSFGVEPQRIRAEVVRLLAAEDDASNESPRMVSVVSHMLDVATSLAHEFAGPEHLLLGLLHDRNNVAVRS